LDPHDHTEIFLTTLGILSSAKEAVLHDLSAYNRARERWIRGETNDHADEVTGHTHIDLLEAWRSLSNAWEHILKGHQ